VRDHYEDLWSRLPPGLDTPDLARRSAFLLEHVAPGDRVLDLGCGEGTFTALLARAGAAPVGFEVADAAVRRARAAHPDLDFRLAPIDGPLELADATVDVVWASEVIEHVADTARWLSEVRRVLRPGGVLVLTTPAHGRARVAGLALRGFERHFDPRGDHLRFYTLRSLRALLEDFDFTAVAVRAVGGPPGWRRALHATARRPGAGA